LPSTTTPDGRSAFLLELLAIREDPKVKRYALRLAGNPDLAEDALNEAYCAVASVRDPRRIRDLRAYFFTVLRKTVNHLRYQLGALLIEDPGRVADSRRDQTGCYALPPRPLDQRVSVGLLFQAWLEPFTTQCGELAAQVPARSPDPGRYRDVIVRSAGLVLRAIATGDVCDADSNSELRAAYPEWFAEPGCAENTCHQRFCRARADVRDLLRAMVNRDDLYP
jgi:hypothetical protein